MPAALLDQKKKEEPELLETKFAFIVFQTPDGLYGITSNINLPITVERDPTQPEIKGALHTMIDTMNNQETSILSAQQVLTMQLQVSQKMQEAQQNQEILTKLHTGRK